MLSTTYDEHANALYISLRRGNVARTDQLDEGTLVDVDANGSALGVEVINPARPWPLAEFLNRYRIEGDNRQLLEQMFPPTTSGRPVTFQSPDADMDATAQAMSVAL